MGRRPLSPRELKKLRGKMKTEELQEVEEVIIRFSDHEIVIPSPQVNKIVLGEEIYQVVGQGIERPRGEETTVPRIKVTDEDVKLVMSQTGATEEEAKRAIEEENGDLAGAILRLKTKK